MSRAASRTTARLEGFSKLASKPMRRIFSAFFFKQYQKFLVAGRPQQRRGGLARPAQAGGICGECLQFVQNASVNGRVA